MVFAFGFDSGVLDFVLLLNLVMFWFRFRLVVYGCLLGCALGGLFWVVCLCDDGWDFAGVLWMVCWCCGCLSDCW